MLAVFTENVSCAKTLAPHLAMGFIQTLNERGAFLFPILSLVFLSCLTLAGTLGFFSSLFPRSVPSPFSQTLSLHHCLHPRLFLLCWRTLPQLTQFSLPSHSPKNPPSFCGNIFSLTSLQERSAHSQHYRPKSQSPNFLCLPKLFANSRPTILTVHQFYLEVDGAELCELIFSW